VARVTFARAIQRHVECPSADIPGTTLRDVLTGYFSERPQARGYVLDDTGAVRRHIAVFLNDTLITDRVDLSDPVTDTDTVAVFQALSGGAT
jgi:molybdopterin synthase sulfur carrier subunit